MKAIIEGHRYLLDGFEQKNNSHVIQFIHKSPNSEGELITLQDGTTNEEVLKMLIDRMHFLQGSFPCRENAIVITKLEESLMWLEKRTANRLARNVEGKHLK